MAKKTPDTFTAEEVSTGFHSADEYRDLAMKANDAGDTGMFRILMTLAIHTLASDDDTTMEYMVHPETARRLNALKG